MTTSFDYSETAQIKNARSEQKTEYDTAIDFPPSTLAEAISTVIVGQDGYDFSDAVVDYRGRIITRDEAVQLYHGPNFPR